MNLLDLSLPEETKVTINGNTYTGKDFTITNETITIDGQIIADSKIHKIDIHVFGEMGLMDLKAGSVTIHGNAEEVKTMSRSVTCGDVSGNVKTMSGNVKCKNIAGNAKTMSGNISL